MQKRDIELFGSRVLTENRKLFLYVKGMQFQVSVIVKFQNLQGLCPGEGLLTEPISLHRYPSYREMAFCAITINCYY